GFSQWNLPATQLDTAWNTPDLMPWAQGASSIPIAVVDTGVRATHEDLAAKMLTGWNTYTGTSDVTDTFDHGTAVASVAAASVNNSVGLAGFAWSCPVLPVKTDGSGGITDADVASAIEWAISNGARVINISLGSPAGPPGADLAACNDAWAAGIPVVAAAGNSGVN